MTTTHLLVTIKSPGWNTAAEAQALLERALAWADIEAAAINDEGDPEAKDLADAMRWLAMEVKVDPVIKDSPPCQHISGDLPRRAGLDPNLAAPYGVVRDPERTAAALERIEERSREVAAEMAKGPKVAIAFRKLSDGDAFYARGRLFPWEKIDDYVAVPSGSRLHYTFNPDETVYTAKEITMTKERLVVVHAQLAFAIPEGQSDDAVFDYANCLLIPNQRVFGDTKTGLIDYTFSDIYVSATPVDEVGKETGFKHEAESKLPAAS